jgi:(S)-ureidoglycine aminohydrolase
MAAVGTIVPGDRGRRGPTFTLLTPANRYVSRTPDLPGAQYFKLVTPRMAPARFGEYLITGLESAMSADVPPGLEHFLFGRGGEVQVRFGDERVDLADGGYLYLGPSQFFTIEFAPGATLLWIKREWEQWKALSEPAPVFGRLAEVEATPTAVKGLQRRELLDPADPAFDFNISHMEFGRNVALAQIEIHDEEHGLYMTSGGGLYHLDGEELEVVEDDFIYMAPYCPQGFRAGSRGGSYLLYKDVYRDGF